MTLTADDIDAILPQTQCGLCGFNGCKPYAEALANKEAPINLCPPGGVQGLLTIAALVNEDPLPFIPDMQQKSKPMQRAVIREAECIGCTKCIKACPVDAILGGPKKMHTVLTDECTGCELCIEPCPVDCIDLIEVSCVARPDQYRQRYQNRQLRLLQLEMKEENIAKPVSDKKSYIHAAILRARQKKLNTK